MRGLSPMEPRRNHSPPGTHTTNQPPTSHSFILHTLLATQHLLPPSTPHGSAPGAIPRPLAYHRPLHLLVDLVELQRIGHGGCGVWEGTGTSSGRLQQPPQPGMPGAAAEESVTAAVGGQRVNWAGDGLSALPSAPKTKPQPPKTASTPAPDAASPGGT